MTKRLFVEVDVRQTKWTIKCAREAVGSSLRGAQKPRQRIQQSCTRPGGGAAKGSALQQLGSQAVSGGFAFVDAYIIILA